MTAKQYKKIALITRVIWLVSTMVFIACQIARITDMTIRHFEDGSGIITYCLPFNDCN